MRTGFFTNTSSSMKPTDLTACSLVITTYNSPDLLDLAIRSALAQSEPPSEILVADDGSTSDTALLIETHRVRSRVPMVHLWQEDLGFRAASSRNRAIAAAKGNYIVIVDGDILMHRDFIRDHKRLALKGTFIQGSRALLSKENTLNRLVTKNITVALFEKGLENRKNVLHLPLLSKLLALKSSSLSGIRSCNMSFFRNDCIRINGFNEDFIGWGREDSEFAARLINSGILRRNVRFSAIASHLWHPENPKHLLSENDRLLEQAVVGRLATCPNGIDKYLAKR
ncbi:Glycosyl transferase, family 2 [Chlorobium ferrooxidans DSM 13031]|uniref:Glycosyl transferase, family 2 n=2 Tax=Chlorobium TaxID=1091 RepID=Q0YSI3_9CHLB|nr:Glycosyl transferase, family 2 [Chlorobium ferrooxidans DSM 13031]